LKEESIIPYKKITSELFLSNTKQHYTEARLVQLLEEKGIGRPSTFSSIVDKIQQREYVKKQDIIGVSLECKDYELENNTVCEKISTREFGNEKSKLVIQPLGIIVIEFLEEKFGELFQYDYTEFMENELDKICNGEKEWQDLCISCFENINKLLENYKSKKYEIKIDDVHYYIIGKNGPVIKYIDAENGRTSFKPIKNGVSLDINKLENGEYNINDLVDNENEIKEKQTIASIGIYQNESLYLKKGKYGLYASWGMKTKSLTQYFGNRPINNISLDELIEVLERTSNNNNNNDVNKDVSTESLDNTTNPTNIIRNITDNISIRNCKYGDYIYYKTSDMKKPQFYKLKDNNKDLFSENYKTCDISLIKKWIKENYNIY
jgi:DNA topoisomerase-1